MTKSLSALRRELAEYRRAAKHRSKVGPQEDAQTLWAKVSSLEAEIAARTGSQS